MIRTALAALMVALLPAMTTAETVSLYAAGSLKAALTEAARAFEAQMGKAHTVTTEFAASGLLRDRIEKGEPAQVFASANMEHPQSLAARGLADGTVALFARNELCGLVLPGVAVTTDTLLDVMLAPATRVGTSTPKADPSGDYAFELFAKAEALRPGAKAALEAKAQQLTGGPTSPKAPDGRNLYAWVMESGKVDIFLTYCTNGIAAKKEIADLQMVQIAPALAVGADYGLVVLKGASAAGKDFAAFILGPAGQAILARHGFGAGVPAVPR